MERLTIPDKPIEGGVKRAVIDVREVRRHAMTIYWRLKKYEDTGIDPERFAEIDRSYQEMARELAELRRQLQQSKKLFVVAADTYPDPWGSCIEIIRVADNEKDADESVEFAERKGWKWVNKEIVELNKPTRKWLGGYEE